MKTLHGAEFFYADAPPLCIFRIPRNPLKNTIHTHDFHELMFITEGQATHVLNNKEDPLLPGDVYLIRPGDKHGHTCSTPDGIAQVNVIFDLERLNLDLRDITAIPGYHAIFAIEPGLRKQTDFTARLRLNPEGLEKALAIVYEMECELAQEEPGYQLKSILLFTELIIFLSRSYSQSEALKNREIQLISETVAFLEHNLAEPLTVAQLAEKAKCSTNRLREIFHSAYGVAPLEYVRRTRINRAIRLLQAGEKNITDIAFDCGFCDSNYFTRTFRKYAGITPSDFRKKSSV